MAAMRVGHSLVPSGVVLRHSNCTPLIPLPSDYGASQGEPALRLCNTYFQLQVMVLQIINVKEKRKYLLKTPQRPFLFRLVQVH